MQIFMRIRMNALPSFLAGSGWIFSAPASGGRVRSGKIINAMIL
jgi:hypothetical protein